jgi:hypothetical protein
VSLGPWQLKLHKSWFVVEGLVLSDQRKLVELAIEKLKSHKSPGINQIPGEVVKAGVD